MIKETNLAVPAFIIYTQASRPASFPPPPPGPGNPESFPSAPGLSGCARCGRGCAQYDPGPGRIPRPGSQGRPDETLEQNNESLLGKRNGTWKKVVALVENLEDSEVKIQEDVEYELGVWVDDSVKWANSYPQEKNINSCESINIPIPSGINYGKITIDIPNQSPPFNREYVFPTSGTVLSVVSKSIQDNLKVVFREPTPDVKITSTKDLKVNKFPSITVEATDFAGNQRIIQLYFRVKDENAKIKTLQRRHQQY